MASDARQWRSDFPPLPCASIAATSNRWFVVSVEPRTEAKVEKALQAAGFGTFVPTVIAERIKRRFRWGRWYDETRRREVIAFPTYVFVSFDPTHIRWRYIAQIAHVRGVMGPTPETPQPVPDSAMAVLMSAAYDRAMNPSQAEALIRAGIAVEVVNGPFANQVGICEWADGKRVALSLSLFGRETKVTLDAADVREAKE
jgi:transcription antitermination factor NusG